METDHDKFGNRPSWEYVNPQILSSVYLAVNNLSDWQSMAKFRNVKAITDDYVKWNRFLIQSYLSLMAHLKEDKDEHYNKDIYNEMYDYVFKGKDLSQERRTELVGEMVLFIKKIGLSRIEMNQEKGFGSLMGND